MCQLRSYRETYLTDESPLPSIDSNKKQRVLLAISGLPNMIFLAVAEAKGKGGKTSALELKAEGDGKGWVFCNYVFSGHIHT